MSHSFFAAWLRGSQSSSRVLAAAATFIALGAAPLYAQETAKVPVAKVAAKASAAALDFFEDDAEPQFTLKFHRENGGGGRRASSPSITAATRTFMRSNSRSKSARLLATAQWQNASTRNRRDQLFPAARRCRFRLSGAVGLMEVVVAQQTILTAYDAARSSGKIGHRESGGWTTVRQPRMQPVEEIYFNDDFTRLPGENGEWKPAFRHLETDLDFRRIGGGSFRIAAHRRRARRHERQPVRLPRRGQGKKPRSRKAGAGSGTTTTRRFRSSRWRAAPSGWRFTFKMRRITSRFCGTRKKARRRGVWCA